jgi:pumilio family protein 6
MSSSNYRGTKRSSDSAPSGRSFKSAKPGGPQRGGPGGGGGGYNKGGSGGGGGYKGGNGGGGGGYKGAKPAWNKGGNGKPSFNKGGKPDFNKGGNFKGKGKAAPREDDDAAPAKRKRPVTQGGGEDDAMSVDDNDDFDGDDFDMEEDGDKEGGEGAGAEGAGAEGGEAVEKRGKMTKEERRALHAEQPHRRTLLPSYVLLTETLLPLWETARQSEMPKEERKAAISELYAAVKGHALEISRGHKGGRVLQTVSVFCKHSDTQ